MTVLDFDPPQPTLRLVSTNGELPARDSRYRTGAPLCGDARELYRQVLQASLAADVSPVAQSSVDPDALRVVLATKQATSAAPARAFSASGIWQLMFVDVVSWCRNRQLDVPAGCGKALMRVVEYLEQTDSFDPLSDPAASLYDAIDECTGGWLDDEPAPRSSSSRPQTSGSTSPSRPRRSLRSSRGPKRT